MSNISVQYPTAPLEHPYDVQSIACERVASWSGAQSTGTTPLLAIPRTLGETITTPDPQHLLWTRLYTLTSRSSWLDYAVSPRIYLAPTLYPPTRRSSPLRFARLRHSFGPFTSPFLSHRPAPAAKSISTSRLRPALRTLVYDIDPGTCLYATRPRHHQRNNGNDGNVPRCSCLSAGAVPIPS